MSVVSNKKTSELVFGASALAVGKAMRTSAFKLNLVAKMIRGMGAEKALAVLKFSHKRIAGEVRKVLLSAIANAEHNKGADPDKLLVTEASVGRAFALKRLDVKGRSRSGRIEKPYSHLRVVVSEVKE
ncbi:MAG: 50S ribosomal protein L22 [Holosporaceae bacterium]